MDSFTVCVSSFQQRLGTFRTIYKSTENCALFKSNESVQRMLKRAKQSSVYFPLKKIVLKKMIVCNEHALLYM